MGISVYQITLDGWNHDHLRKHTTGKGTLEKILSNLKLIAALPKEVYNFQIILRHNITAAWGDLSWYDYLYQLFGQDSRFVISVNPVNNWGGENVASLDLLTNDSKKRVLKKHEDYIRNLGFKMNTKTELFDQICYAGIPHSYVIRADGRLEKCTVALNHPLN